METGKRNGCLQSILITVGIFAAIIFLIAAILVGVFLYHVEFRREKLTEFHSEDGAYTLTVTRVGEPMFFSPDYCELTLKRGRKRISQSGCEVANDGAFAHSSNFAVQWEEEKVTVIVSSEEGLDEKYELWFDGSITSSTLYEDTATETAAVSFLCLVYDA